MGFLWGSPVGVAGIWPPGWNVPMQHGFGGFTELLTALAPSPQPCLCQTNIILFWNLEVFYEGNPALLLSWQPEVTHIDLRKPLTITLMPPQEGIAVVGGWHSSCSEAVVLPDG